jgi:hypothetical protein
MRDTDRSARADELLQAYFGSGEEAEAENVLSELVTSCISPLIQEIVRHKLHTSIGQNTVRGADASEVCSTALVKVLSKLREWKLDPGRMQKGPFLDYVAVVSYHTCNQYWRDAHPVRNRLKNRLFYLLTSRSDFAIWKKDGIWICGSASWKSRADLADQQALNQLDAGEIRSENRAEQLASIFKKLTAPVRLNDLLNAIMSLEGISPQENRTRPVEELPDARSEINFDQKLQERQLLERLWTEIQDLSMKQRAALLLSLRDENRGAVLQLFPAMGIATIKQLCAVLSMDVRQLGDLWKELPLDDLRIGSLLGITRQQVINLRKCARERLSRRLGAGN